MKPSDAKRRNDEEISITLIHVGACETREAALVREARERTTAISLDSFSKLIVATSIKFSARRSKSRFFALFSSGEARFPTRELRDIPRIIQRTSEELLAFASTASHSN